MYASLYTREAFVQTRYRLFASTYHGKHRNVESLHSALPSSLPCTQKEPLHQKLTSTPLSSQRRTGAFNDGYFVANELAPGQQLENPEEDSEVLAPYHNFEDAEDYSDSVADKQLMIEMYRVDHERAIGFDEADDDEFYPTSSRPTSSATTSPAMSWWDGPELHWYLGGMRAAQAAYSLRLNGHNKRIV